MIGVIADDLTGAAEIGAVGWHHGLRAEIVGSGSPSHDVDLVCVDTDSRSAPPDDAGRRATVAAQTLQRAGARWIYKKVDSVLRGHVIVELDAIRKELGCRSALLVPANPARGRVVRDGRYFIGEKPIDETDFSRDPEYPRRTSNVVELLGGASAGAVQVCGVDTSHLPDGLVVGEAAAPADLQRLAEHCSKDVLMGGGAEFFDVLLRTRARGHQRGAHLLEVEHPRAPEVFICGSLSEAAARFADLARSHGTPVFTLPRSLMSGRESGLPLEDQFIRQVVESLASHPYVVLNTPANAALDPATPHQPARELTRLALEALREASVSHAYVEGGATAAELLTHIGWERLRILGELAPGVVRLEVCGGPTRLQLTVKPGSYEWPQFVRNRIAGNASTA